MSTSSGVLKGGISVGWWLRFVDDDEDIGTPHHHPSPHSARLCTDDLLRFRETCRAGQALQDSTDPICTDFI